MRLENLPPNISEETVIRLRAKMEDMSFKLVEERGSSHIALRVPGEKIDLLHSLEYLAEFVGEDMLKGVELIMIISDREVEIADASIMLEKVRQKKADDDTLYAEVRGRVRKGTPPLIFTMENDILELYRIALRARGKVGETTGSPVLDTPLSDLPKEGSIIYLLYDDGFRKMDRRSFEREIFEAMSRVQVQPKVARDEPDKAWPSNEVKPFDRSGQGPKQAPQAKIVRLRFDRIRRIGDKAFARGLIRELGDLGYREDSRFSRPDVNQFLLVGMRGPTILLKVALEDEDLSPFYRILDHRRDVLGILTSDIWTPSVQASSIDRGFHYLTGDSIGHVKDLVKEILAGGEN